MSARLFQQLGHGGFHLVLVGELTCLQLAIDEIPLDG